VQQCSGRSPGARRGGGGEQAMSERRRRDGGGPLQGEEKTGEGQFE